MSGDVMPLGREEQLLRVQGMSSCEGKMKFNFSPNLIRA